MNNEIDEIDDYDYNYNHNNNEDYNEDYNSFNNEINRALELSLKDVNQHAKYLNTIFEQYLSADDDLKNIILQDLSQDDLNDMITLIQSHDDIAQKNMLNNERQMLIQLQDIEYNESLKSDTLIQEKIKDTLEEKIEKDTVDDIRKKRVDYFNKK